jgi:hypothetical protein
MNIFDSKSFWCLKQKFIQIKDKYDRNTLLSDIKINKNTKLYMNIKYQK